MLSIRVDPVVVEVEVAKPIRVCLMRKYGIVLMGMIIIVFVTKNKRLAKGLYSKDMSMVFLKYKD